MLDEDERLMKLYKEMNADRKDFSDREWETVKFITSLFGIFLAATITIITYLYPNYEILWIFSFLPIFMFGISYYGLRNFKRECARLFERIATLMKIEEQIGFHKERVEYKNRKVLKCDDYYLPTEFVNSGKKYKCTEEFVRKMIEDPPKHRYGNSYVMFRRLFILYMIISAVLVFLMFYLKYFPNL